MKKGEVTAFLSLIFLLLISFSGSLMESASLQMAKNYRRADMNRAVESVFAEFQKDLLEEFDIFGMDAGYQTGSYSEQNIINRLEFYGASGIEQEIPGLQLLTDHQGQAFYRQAVKHIQHKYGLDGLNQYTGQTGTWEKQKKRAEEYRQEEESAGNQLETELAENEGTLPGENNPLPNIAAIKSKSLLDVIMPKERAVSEKQVNTGGLVSGRERQQGYGSFAGEEEGADSMLMFGEYLLGHFSMAVPDGEATNVRAAGGLDYELEYILEGRGSDRENLEAVTNKLMLLRFVPNYAYLQGSGEMRGEAEALSLALCTAAMLPMLTEVVTQVILLGWAFGECIMDLRALLNGGKVPLVKSRESWQLQLSALLTLGTEEDKGEGKDTEGGISYREYLRMLLFLKNRQDLSMRGLDMAELRIREEKGHSWFRADLCVTRIKMTSTCHLRRGITYEFQTEYGYR